MTRLTVDAAVVGGGLIGTWTALFLAKRGRKVALLDKGYIGAQSSGVNFGNLRLQGRHPAQYPLSMRAQALWEDLENLIGDRCEFDPTGHLYCAYDDKETEALHHYAEGSEANGLAIERLDGAALAKRFPWISGKAVAATYSPRDATANPRLVSPAVARAAKALGATIIENCRVQEIVARGGSFELRTETELTIDCGQVVNSAGAWGTQIAADFGETAPTFPAGPPQFVTEPLPYFLRPSVQTIDGTVIARQIPRGNVILTGYPRTASDPVANKAPVPPFKTLAGMRHLTALIPKLQHAHVIRVWSGIEAYLPDMIPIIGPSATTPGLIHAFGFCGHGFQIGPGVGLCLSEMIIDGTTPTPLGAFSIERFRGDVAASEKFRKEFD